jgi:hypothetical protein
MRNRWLVILMLVVPTASPQAHQRPSSVILKVVPGQLESGQSATLTWDVGEAQAFLIGYGKISGKGSATVTPDSTTRYILIAESAGSTKRYEYRIERLVVTGARGEDEFPPLAGFTSPLYGSRNGTGYVEFHAAVCALLQSEGYAVRGDYLPHRPYVTFQTDFVLRPDLVPKGDKIRARRLALAVDVYEPKKSEPLAYSVRVRLEFQYRGETDWHAEQDKALSAAEANKLLQSLQSAK